jgi:hypothetical protein
MDNEEKVIEESIYNLMKNMKIGEKMVVPLEMARNARSYANYLKENYDLLFSVNRMHSNKTKIDFALVTRTL